VLFFGGLPLGIIMLVAAVLGALKELLHLRITEDQAVLVSLFAGLMASLLLFWVDARCARFVSKKRKVSNWLRGLIIKGEDNMGWSGWDKSGNLTTNDKTSLREDK
jgi:hypothetical protein